MHKYSRTGFRPAELHLSRSAYLGNNSIFHLISGDSPSLSPQLGELKEALEEARKLNQAKKTLLEEGAKDMAINERRHGILSPDSEFLEKYPRLGLVLILTHKKEKLSKTPTYVGPALILARQALDRNLFLLDLTSGHVLKRSYRQVKPYVSSEFLNLPEDVRDTLQAILPLGVILQGDEIPTLGEGLSTGDWTFDKKQHELSTVLANILQVFKLIKPSLPELVPTTPYVVDLTEERADSINEEPPLSEEHIEEDEEEAPPREVQFNIPPPSHPPPSPDIPMRPPPMHPGLKGILLSQPATWTNLETNRATEKAQDRLKPPDYYTHTI